MFGTPIGIHAVDSMHVYVYIYTHMYISVCPRVYVRRCTRTCDAYELYEHVGKMA